MSACAGINDGINDDYIYNNAFLGEQYLHVECEYEDSSVKNTYNGSMGFDHMETNLPKMDPMDSKTIIHNDMFLNTFAIMNTIQRYTWINSGKQNTMQKTND